MTAAERPERRWLRFAAHHRVASTVLWLATVTAIAIWPTGLLSGVLLVIGGVALLAGAFGELYHQGILCDYCIARFPLDGSEQAERRSGWLRYFHYGRIPVMFLGIGACVAMFLLRNPYFLVLAATETMITAYDANLHRRLEPWCPWCRRDEDDDFEQDTSPVLDGHQRR